MPEAAPFVLLRDIIRGEAEKIAKRFADQVSLGTVRSVASASEVEVRLDGMAITIPGILYAVQGTAVTGDRVVLVSSWGGSRWIVVANVTQEEVAEHFHDDRYYTESETDSAIDADITAHSGDTDPHGDRAYADSLDHDHATPIATHAGAADPHGDRAYADSLDHDHATPIATHSGATDPHGDRAYADSLDHDHATPIATHAGAADPHGDRAYADSAIDTDIATHASDEDAHHVLARSVPGVFSDYSWTASTAWEVVGSVTLAQPGGAVNVVAMGWGNAYDPSHAGHAIRIRIQVSVDGGSTWAYTGPVMITRVGTFGGSVNTYQGLAVGGPQVTNVTPTGSVQARLQAYCGDNTTAQLLGPGLNLHLTPV